MGAHLAALDDAESVPTVSEPPPIMRDAGTPEAAVVPQRGLVMGLLAVLIYDALGPLEAPRAPRRPRLNARDRDP